MGKNVLYILIIKLCQVSSKILIADDSVFMQMDQKPDITGENLQKDSIPISNNFAYLNFIPHTNN